MATKHPSPWWSAALVLAVLSTGCGSPAERAAEPIVERNVVARGGLKAWRQVKAMSLSGRLEAGLPRDPVQVAEAALRSRSEAKAQARRAQLHGAEAPQQVQLPFVMELKRPRASRLEIQFQGRTAVQVFDGTRGWKVRPFLGRREVEPYSADELQLASQQAELDGLLIDHAAKGSKVVLEGNEKVEGRDAYRLQVTSATGQVRHVLVDAESYLEVRVDGTRRLDGKSRTVWTAFRDYKLVDGLLIPHTLETTVEGIVGTEKIVVERVSLNAEVADARFSKPE